MDSSEIKEVKLWLEDKEDLNRVLLGILGCHDWTWWVVCELFVVVMGLGREGIKGRLSSALMRGGGMYVDG